MGLDKVVILAAGAGTRMKSKLPKVIHEVCGKPMVKCVIDEVKKTNCDEVIVIIGNGADLVKEKIEDVKFAVQKEQLGTGHAVMQAAEFLNEIGNVMVLCGDTPLITKETIEKFVDYHEQSDNDISVLTAMFEDPTGYGRIVKDDSDNISKIVEQKDCTKEELEIKEVNSGIYCFKADVLEKYLNDINNNNAQNEYYLTDIVTVGIEHSLKVGTQVIDNIEEIKGVNSKRHLFEVNEILRKRINNYHMDNGVTIINSNDTYIDLDIKIGRDTVIFPGAMISKAAVIGEDCIIGQNSRISNSTIGNGVEIQSSIIIDSIVDNESTVGPYAYLRPGSEIGKNVKIGDFVEVKKSVVGDGSKASHLAYIGDAEIGKNVNIGCGVVFVNYDGENKHKTIVEDNAFIGSNSNLVAPITVRKDGYIAAGSTITREVEAGSLSVERSKQRNIENWVYRKRK